MRIMLVDDSKTMRNIQKKVLGEFAPGAEFVEARDGVEALVAFKGAFDFVLIDWNMPNMDGLTLVTKLRAVDKTTPLIMCTTEAEKVCVVKALKAGVNNYIIKPFTPESLTEKVKQTLARKAA